MITPATNTSIAELRSLFSEDGDVAGHDALEAAVGGAEEEGAIGVQGFGAAVDGVGAGLDADLPADGAALGNPFVGHFVEIAVHDAFVVVVELAKDFGGEGGAVLGL